MRPFFFGGDDGKHTDCLSFGRDVPLTSEPCAGRGGAGRAERSVPTEFSFFDVGSFARVHEKCRRNG